MRQTVIAPLQAQMQQKDNLFKGYSVSKPAFAARLLRNDWDDTIHYKLKVGVLMLDHYLQPLGTCFEYIHNGEIVNIRKLCHAVVAANAAHVYIAANCPAAVYNQLMTIEKPTAEALALLAVGLQHVDVGTMGYLLIDPFDHVYMETDYELLNFKK